MGVCLMSSSDFCWRFATQASLSIWYCTLHFAIFQAFQVCSMADNVAITLPEVQSTAYLHVI